MRGDSGLEDEDEEKEEEEVEEAEAADAEDLYNILNTVTIPVPSTSTCITSWTGMIMAMRIIIQSIHSCGNLGIVSYIPSYVPVTDVPTYRC